MGVGGDEEMNITITINTDNAAFRDKSEREVSRILAVLADDFLGGPLDSFIRDGEILRDINGNVVGRVTIKE